MTEYPIKRGHGGKTEGDNLKKLLISIFGDVYESGEWYKVSYGAIKEMRVKKRKSMIVVEMDMNKSVEENVAVDTIKKYNKFLEIATGYTAKERKSKLQKMAKEGKI